MTLTSTRSAKAFPLVEEISHIFRFAFSLSFDEEEEEHNEVLGNNPAMLQKN